MKQKYKRLARLSLCVPTLLLFSCKDDKSHHDLINTPAAEVAKQRSEVQDDFYEAILQLELQKISAEEAASQLRAHIETLGDIGKIIKAKSIERSMFKGNADFKELKEAIMTINELPGNKLF